MARIRTVKPELFRHDALFEAEQNTSLPLRLAYIGLFTACDREGRFRWRPRALKLDVLPYDQIDFSRVLDALLTRGFIVKYERDGEEFGCIPSWGKHQIINNREAASTIPSPEESSICTRDPRVIHASTTPLNLAQGEKEKEKEKEKEEEEEMKKERKKESAVITRPESVSQQIWDDWLTVRKKKKAPLTQTAWELLESEAAKAGWTIERAIEECCLRSWVSFKAEWVSEQKTKNSNNHQNEHKYTAAAKVIFDGIFD